MSVEISQSVQDYAKAIYSLEAHGGEAVSTSALAERLGVSPASASAMVRRLSELGLARRERYRGVTLTPAGQRVALEVMRHHRLIELYLAEALGMSWDQVHKEAEVLEHAISPELSELIAKKLGNPTRDPHGDPIPTADGKIDEGDTKGLSEIAPGVELEVRGREPFGGPVRVRVAGRDHALGFELARAMRVEPVTG
jgi:DtxR family Mn-dependent transcriptional regulator